MVCSRRPSSEEGVTAASGASITVRPERSLTAKRILTSERSVAGSLAAPRMAKA